MSAMRELNTPEQLLNVLGTTMRNFIRRVFYLQALLPTTVCKQEDILGYLENAIQNAENKEIIYKSSVILICVDYLDQTTRIVRRLEKLLTTSGQHAQYMWQWDSKYMKAKPKLYCLLTVPCPISDAALAYNF